MTASLYQRVSCFSHSSINHRSRQAVPGAQMFQSAEFSPAYYRYLCNGLPAFVELFAPPSAMPGECLIEFESLHGSKVRIPWKAATSPDWMSLLRAWRETER
jgi:hypothetical protein